MPRQYFCVHGHFYQPPREDPLLGEIPVEKTAAPYRNWNEKIHEECYKPNALLGNFYKISYNVGPTLFSWMASYDPVTYSRIIEQDQANFRQNGVGNAISQSYNHVILPLASYNEKVTQIRWGIADFKHRFGHRPQGMWLPETAVDTETLEVLADHDIEFTILAPWQAKGNNINPYQPYKVSLPSGKSINVFFFHMELSSRISFDPNSTINADRFITEHLLPVMKQNDDKAELLLIATDGELYGHHQVFRDKFLARLVNGAIAENGLKLTYPGLWLKEHPVEQTIEIQNKTSWSCHHGISRWEKDCPCTPGAYWKEPFRKALNHLAGELDIVYENVITSMKIDPWELRNSYIEALLGNVSVEELIEEQVTTNVPKSELWRIKILLEAQRERLRMFTSCGWFFDSFDRLEPRKNLAYAAQAVWLTRLATGVDLVQNTNAWLEYMGSPRTGLSAQTIFNVHLRFAEEYYREKFLSS